MVVFMGDNQVDNVDTILSTQFFKLRHRRLAFFLMVPPTFNIFSLFFVLRFLNAELMKNRFPTLILNDILGTSKSPIDNIAYTDKNINKFYI